MESAPVGPVSCTGVRAVTVVWSMWLWWQLWFQHKACRQAAAMAASAWVEDGAATATVFSCQNWRCCTCCVPCVGVGAAAAAMCPGLDVACRESCSPELV